MNVAKSCRAEDVSVSSCFLVNVRKARGRRMAGGIRIGNVDGFDVPVFFTPLIGWTGVLKAGEEDGIRP